MHTAGLWKVHAGVLNLNVEVKEKISLTETGNRKKISEILFLIHGFLKFLETNPDFIHSNTVTHMHHACTYLWVVSEQYTKVLFCVF